VTAAAPSAAIRRLAWFRYEIRRFLRFSEQAARRSRLTPAQYQLLLGVAGYTGRGWATITELAEFLQARHNAVVELVNRGARRGLVRRERGSGDRRFVQVRLSPAGARLLARLAHAHLEEIRRIRALLPAVEQARPRRLEHGGGARRSGARR